MAQAVEKPSVIGIERPTATSIVQVIERAAMNPNVDIDKMERLLQMQERILARESEQLFNAAMNDAQEAMRPVSQDASNPQTRSKYASYAALDRVLRPIYTGHGFSLSFNTADGAPEGHIRVVCKVAHRDGHSDYPHLDMPADGKGAKGGDVMTKTHATMSALSYAKRGLLKMIFNIAEGEHDDDGNAAGQGDRVSEEQLALLIAKADEVGADKAAFCRFYEVGALSDIAAVHFDKAMAALEAKREKINA